MFEPARPRPEVVEPEELLTRFWEQVDTRYPGALHCSTYLRSASSPHYSIKAHILDDDALHRTKAKHEVKLSYTLNLVARRRLTVSAMLLLLISRTWLSLISATTSWCWASVILLLVLRLSLRRAIILARSAISLVGGVLATSRSAILTTGSTKLTWRSAHRCAAHVLLLIFGVVARVDGAEDELQHPEVRSKVDRRLCAGHLGGLILVV